jgi:hypothetical protein
VQSNHHHLLVIRKHPVDDLRQQLLPRFRGMVELRTLLPVIPEVLDQIRCFLQLVVVNRTQRLDLLLQLAAFLQVFLPVDESFVPPQVNPLDDGLDLFHPPHRGFILDPAAHFRLHAFAEIVGYLQVGQRVHHLGVHPVFTDTLLVTGLVAAVLIQRVAADDERSLGVGADVLDLAGRVPRGDEDVVAVEHVPHGHGVRVTIRSQRRHPSDQTLLQESAYVCIQHHRSSSSTNNSEA